VVIQTKILKQLLLLSLGCLLLTCKAPQPAPEYRVPEDVEPFVRLFEAEARKRGIDMTIDNLIVEFAKPENDLVCGMCRSGQSRQKTVLLSTDAYCWREATSEAKEALVFHELGHCFLARQHTSRRFVTGDYASLMNPDDVTIYSRCIYAIAPNCDKRSRRQYYIDELFDETTPQPAWAR
jgi:Putative phage metallopeptidase